MPERGFNAELCNALTAGGARNGVLTAIDYVAQSALRFELISLPIYYGLTVLVTRGRLDRDEVLADALTEL